MSRIVKPDDTDLKSLSTAPDARQALYDRREEVHALVRRYDEEGAWDQMQARDVPGEMIDFVIEQLEQGCSYDMVRRKIGIRRSTDKAWRKIMAALKQGFRIDGQAHLQQIAFEYRNLSQKMLRQIHEGFEHGVPMMDKEGNVQLVRGPSPQLAGMIDTYNRLNQGFIKNAKDLGAYVEHDGKGQGQGGVTIVVQSAVQLPSAKDVKAEQDRQREKNQVLLAQGREMTRVEAP